MKLFDLAPRWTRWPLVGLAALAALVLGISESDGQDLTARLFKVQAAKAAVDADPCAPRFVLVMPDGSEIPVREFRFTPPGATPGRITWTAPACIFGSSFE